MDEIEFIFDTYHVATLFEMAGAAGLQVMQGRKKMNKADLAAKMRAEFFTCQRVLASVDQLNPRERAVFDRLLLQGGEIATAAFKRELVRAELVVAQAETSNKSGEKAWYGHSSVPYAVGEYCGHPSRAKSLVFEDVVARLTQYGLVFSRDVSVYTSGGMPYKLQFHPAKTLYIPQVIRACLPTPPPLEVSDAFEPDQVRGGEPVYLLRDLYLYWDFVRRNEVKLLQNGLVAKRTLKAINAVLLRPDPELDIASGERDARRLYMLRMMLGGLGLLARRGDWLWVTGEQRDQTTLHIPDFWHGPLARQLSACLGSWAKLVGLEELRGEIEQYDPRYAHARQALLSALQTVSPNRWYEFADFLDRIRGRDGDFLLADHSKVAARRHTDWYTSYSSAHFSGKVSTLLEKFERFEADFIRAGLTGFLHQAGLVELGYRQDQCLGFRLTPAGSALLEIWAGNPDASHAWPADPGLEGGKLIIQPNFQLMAIGPVSLARLACLDLFAERERTNPGAFEYRLSRESAYRAQQAGLDVAEIIRFLEENADVDLPQNVRRSLEEWGAHHDRIVFRIGVGLIQTADAALLAQLQADAHTGPGLARSLTPQVALLDMQSVQQLIPALVARGLFPAVAGAQPQAADHAIIVEENGLLRPVHAVPDLYLRERVSRLAEDRPGGGWQLTPDSVRRAGGSRNKVLAVLEELRKLHRGADLPAPLVEQIKTWGGYYGDAAAQTLTLIEFHDHSTLEELLQHPALKTCLTPFVTDKRALAIVPEGQLAGVKAILAGLGVRVRDGLCI